MVGRSLAAIALVLVLAASCAEAETEVVLTIRDVGLPESVTALRLEVCGADGVVVAGQEAVFAGSGAEVILPAHQHLAPIGRDATRLWGVRLGLLDASGTLLGEIHRAGEFSDGQSVEHVIDLEPTCIGVFDCPVGTSCRGGTCEPIVLAPLTVDDPRVATLTRCGGETVPACEGAGDGASCPGGTCLGGECCRGCIDGAGACVAGDGVDACGSGGGACAACTGCASDVCTAGACQPLHPARSVEAGVIHTCAVTTDDELYCWGTNDWGALGFGSYMDPEQFPRRFDGAWSDASVFLTVSCAITRAASATEAEIWCWGANYSLQLGYSSDPKAGRLVPTATTAGAAPWTDVKVGSSFACALDASGRLLCWGQGDQGAEPDGIASGANGLGTGMDTHVPTVVPGSWARVAAGGAHGCAISAERRLFCWGDNEFGQVGNGGVGRAENQLAPVEVVGEGPWLDVSAGAQHTCAIDAGHGLYCWGRGNNGRAGGGSVNDVPVPSLVNADRDWAQVSPGGVHTCALRLDGSLWCLGYNGSGQCGQEAVDDVLMPARVGTRDDWTVVDAGGDHTCAIDEHGALYCFGDNSVMQLGFVTTERVYVPTRVCIE